MSRALPRLKGRHRRCFSSLAASGRFGDALFAGREEGNFVADLFAVEPIASNRIYAFPQFACWITRKSCASSSVESQSGSSSRKYRKPLLPLGGATLRPTSKVLKNLHYVVWPAGAEMAAKILSVTEEEHCNHTAPHSLKYLCVSGRHVD